MTSETLITAAANHLWQSTAFAAMAALIALALRKNDARTRYRVWLAASLKFMAPFAVLVTMGSHLKMPTQPMVSPSRLLLVEQIGQPFGLLAAPHVLVNPAPAAGGISLSQALFAIWLSGALFVLALWFVRWRRAALVIRAAHPIPVGRAAVAVRRLAERAGIRTPVRIVSSRAPLEPGVFGWLRPVLFLPEGIEKHLSAEQLEAVIAHEICHVRRRDNLFAAVHMLVEAAFWFHPLVWWIGTRLLEERERACDEEVLGSGNQPTAYAEGILRTCRFYLESPSPCMSGVTGADLRERIVRITSQMKARNSGPGQKTLLALAAALAIMAPVIFGLLRAPAVRAQSQPAAAAPEAFEVASIKPSDPSSRNTFVNITPGGGFRASNINLKFLIRIAYHVQDFQISGGPSWMNSERYDIEATSSDGAGVDIRKMSEAQREEYQKRIELKVKSLLADRFKLTIHRESKDVPIYELVVAKNGPKLVAAAADDGKGPRGMRMRPGQFEGMGATVSMLAQTLSDATGRKVVDKTGIAGNYDFKLDWTPEPGQMAPPPGGEPGPALPPPDPNGPSIFTAIQEQLGLKLESAKGPVEVIVIDKVEKPSAN